MITFFDAIRNNCKHEHPGYNEDHQLEYTCRHKDNTPPGSSWGVCDEAHCPIMKQHMEALIPPMPPSMTSGGTWELHAQEAPLEAPADPEPTYHYFVSYICRSGVGCMVMIVSEPLEEMMKSGKLNKIVKGIESRTRETKVVILNFHRL